MSRIEIHIDDGNTNSRGNGELVSVLRKNLDSLSKLAKKGTPSPMLKAMNKMMNNRPAYPVDKTGTPFVRPTTEPG